MVPNVHTPAIGIDLCDINRFRRSVEKNGSRLLQKLFTADEIGFCKNRVTKYECFAARFAAKEALLKALGTGLRNNLRWTDIEVKNDDLGKPYFKFHRGLNDRLQNRTVLL